MTEVQQSKFRLLIMDLLGLPIGSVCPADESQPTEHNQYVIVQFGDYMTVGQHGTQHENDIQSVHQNSEITITLDFFGDNALSIANTLPAAFRSSPGIYGLDDLGLGLLRVSAARNLSALELDRITRYQANYQFSMVSSFSTPLATIETVSIGLKGD